MRCYRAVAALCRSLAAPTVALAILFPDTSGVPPVSLHLTWGREGNGVRRAKHDARIPRKPGGKRANHKRFPGIPRGQGEGGRTHADALVYPRTPGEWGGPNTMPWYPLETGRKGSTPKRCLAIPPETGGKETNQPRCPGITRKAIGRGRTNNDALVSPGNRGGRSLFTSRAGVHNLMFICQNRYWCKSRDIQGMHLSSERHTDTSGHDPLDIGTTCDRCWLN